MFKLRYKSALASRFDSKNNYGKRVAYVMLATELSVVMQREFTAKQVQDKLAKMKTEWSLSKPTLPAPTGNSPQTLLPLDYDVMLDYWGEKAGFRRESLMSTDDVSDEEISTDKNDNNPDNASLSDDERYAGEKAQQPEQNKIKTNGKSKKTTSPSESLEAGFTAIKEGLMFLGSAMAQQTPSHQVMAAAPTPATQTISVTTLDDVLSTIKAQSDTMSQVLSHLIAKKD
ncbi:hypothetical protein H257_10879 [Aphanomyces astaci]|uniref:Uncharacterized protein n=1 Tax=Aphanomyces astaci TaxID=112090 RepID=W4G789_APHAT|nr:hypothetical protein H257_10879 [Aphanomyces astaci]ETV74818.1 hypothetical protein H257_10879 [Aphanomyces astaci]|eukprot:XP_009835905.1 hypothetical protein H257_10879 [Aphanomyces astaci]